VPCPFPAPTKDHQAAEPPPGRPPTTTLDPDLFFTAPSTPIRVGGSRLPPAPPSEEQTDGESEGLCSPPTSPSGSYMTAEGGSWGSSGTASTSPSCSPNLVAEAEAMAVGEAEGLVEVEAMAALPTCLEDPSTFTPPCLDEEEEDGPFTPLEEEEDDDDGQTPEEEEDEEEWEVSESEGLIPAALLPFRGSLLFQAEAVEIAPLPPGTAPLPCSAEEEDEDDDEEEEEEEEEGGSTSASFLRSLSETSITEGVDESFAFRDDTSASSDSAAYDGEEDERLYGTERHAVGAEAGATAVPPGTTASGDGGIELHLHDGMAPASSPAAEGSPRHRGGEDLVSAVLGGENLGAEQVEPGMTERDGSKTPQEPSGDVEPAASDSVLQPPGLCSRDPQSHGLGGDEVAPANGEHQGGHESDSDDDGDGDHELGTVRAGSTELAANDGHDELDTVATNLVPLVTPSPPDEPDTVATNLVP
ncbi:NACAD protein, partial [Eurystomus gularis]|nr:NACAD protein [Eurystomus gularis]